ncbi:Polyubiquitin-B [Symbiodinium microadriaticum]|uniref:Polyubiquitin-B n=1 Tax=Symbiodinium microadriaticum TaxID=2951 RepID=A0A1Q9E846_SYMMI|nr:Polyubiquitin-B [Symbiodinium microadriaticum]
MNESWVNEDILKAVPAPVPDSQPLQGMPALPFTLNSSWQFSFILPAAALHLKPRALTEEHGNLNMDTAFADELDVTVALCRPFSLSIICTHLENSLCEAPSVHSGDSTAEMVVRAATAMPEAPMSLSKIVQAEIEDETIRLAVLMVSGRALVLQARTLQTVAELKSDIETKERIPVQEQSLLFQDEILQNSRKLHEYGLRHDSCISLVRVQPMELKIMTARVKWSIRVQPQDTVEELKAFVNEKMSIPFEQMLFVCRGKPLDDGRPLQEMGVETGDQVAMILRLKGCGQFIVETDGGTSFRVDGACADKTISEVKTAIRDRTGMAPAEQHLTFRKQVLEDAQTLEYYGIKRECKIQLARRQPQDGCRERAKYVPVLRKMQVCWTAFFGRGQFINLLEAARHRAMQGSADSEYTYDWRSTWGPESRRRSDRRGELAGDWRSPSPGHRDARDTSTGLIPTDYGDDHYVAANMKIASHPGHYMNHEASHLINPLSVEYWASLPGQVRDQAFAFEFEQGHVLAAVEWKDRGDGMGVQRLSLEAKVNGEWQKLSTWEAARKPVWQVHKMTMSMRSSLWRLTFLQNHGDENHLVVQAVRFVIKLQKTEPAHNVGYPQKITRQIWGDRRFTDVEVICGEQHFPVHRAVLAAASTVFAAMLGAEMKESHAREIVISDTDEESVQHMLEYIYTGCVAERAGCGMESSNLYSCFHPCPADMVRLPGLGTRPFSQKGSRSTVPVYRPRGSIEQEQARAARQQEELVQHNILDRSPGQPPKTMVTAASWIREPFIWSSPAARAYRLPLLRPMFANVYANCAKFRRKRVVVDSVISEEEARVYTHDAKDAHGDPLFQIDEMFGVDAECSTAFQDWPDNPLNQEIPDRIRFLIRRHFSEKRPLHLVGAMLRRTRPGGECGYDRGPTICHVDKANISYYDYSAILYLSTKGTDFEGG